MKPAKIREMTEEELQRQEVDLRSDLFNLKIRQASRQLEQPLRIRMLRRDLARVRTISRERVKSAR